MQPCSREMQGMNSLLNPPQISLQDLHNQQIQIQNSQIHHHQHHQVQNSGHFDPTSQEDFLEQMFSTISPSCSWSDLNPTNPTKTAWELKPRDLSDESVPSNHDDNNVAFQFDDSSTLASKLRNHQISGSVKSASAAALMLQQQLLMSRGVTGAGAGVGESGLIQMPLSLGSDDVVDGSSSFKSANPGGEGSIQALYNGFAGSIHAQGQTPNQAQHFQHPQGQNYGAPGAVMNQAPASGSAGSAPAQPRQRVRARRGQATDPHSIAERLRRERIAERMKALQELVPNANKTDKPSMLDEIIDYVKFLHANPLAGRHHRVPILPISGCLPGPPAADPVDGFLAHDDGDETIDEEDEDEAASWLLLNPVKNNYNQNNGFLFGGEVDEYVDFVEYNSCADQNQFEDQYNHHQQQHYAVPQKSYGGDSVVPVQNGDMKAQLHHQPQQQDFQLGLDFESSKSTYSYHGSSSHSVSVSSMDVGVVPESTMIDISISHPRTPKGTIDLFSGPPLLMPHQLTPLDREARVLRYREKKKTRKFEKTIRYASRKAYAETRPRIKGRFAKRTDIEVEVDRMFSTTLMAETGYGIVPSF